MNFERFIILLFLFCFTIFLFPNIETAIDAVSIGEPLKPLFEVFPIAFIGCVFFTLFYLGVRE